MAENKASTMTDQAESNKAPSPLKALTLDVALYEKYLKESELSEDQKQAFLENLWSIIVGFVDLGFKVHPLQQADPNGCGQEIDLTSFMATDVISSRKGLSQNQFTSAADCSDEQEAERMES